MLRVRVLFFGVLKDLLGRSEEVLELAAPITAGALLDRYCATVETLRARRPSILIAKNREFATPDTPIDDNDEVAFLPPVSGGSKNLGGTQKSPNSLSLDTEPGSVSDHIAAPVTDHIFAITREPINTQALVRKLLRGADGAAVTFEGVVRDNTKGRPTLYLEYECYESMAIAQMARIGQEIAAQYAIGRIGVVHRLGRLQIGEASVVVVATAPHRRPAFDAALEAINRLKREVPIWKKEFFADGAVWVDGEWDDRLLAGSKVEQ